MSLEVGRRLQQAREALGLSVEDIENRTRIDQKYISAMEEGNFDFLPSSIYVRSYLRSYAVLVGEDFKILIKKVDLSKNSGNDYGKDDSPISVSTFISKNASEGIFFREGASQTSASNKVYTQNDSRTILKPVVATGFERDYSTRRVLLPTDLPEPIELGIRPAATAPDTERKIADRTSTFATRSLKAKKTQKEKNTNGRGMYTWVLIFLSVLLVIATIYGLVYVKSEGFQNVNACGLVF